MIKECKACGYPFEAKHWRDKYGSLLCKEIMECKYRKDRYAQYKKEGKVINGVYISEKPRKLNICIYCGYTLNTNMFNLCQRKKRRIQSRLDENTYHFKIKRSLWMNSSEGRGAVRKSNKNFKKSIRGRLSEYKYRRTDKRKAVLKKYNQSPKGIIANRMKVMRYYERKVLIDRWTRIPLEIGHLVFKLFNYRCVNCNINKQLVIDHFYPLKKGNSIIKDGKLNGCLLCNCCNLRKKDLSPEEFFDKDKFRYIKTLLDSVDLQKELVKMKD